MIDYRIPEIGEILIEQDGNVPFTVIGINNGLVNGLTPAGEAYSCSIESEPHLIDQFDL
jgi:hypothetical protein